ncbi:type VI secretion system baseplate subunit TssF [Shewanella psychropiezotolerans]|uniref:Type VI secretion system baseplate subunit TssF n=1 Tax=Shewanella psychropiezotolerans TaxID=2593655 RepID=A0ABX5WX34_9GAMM|nr:MULTISPECIES: type VI secretion system baseplate subunit TssF [Shewanella]MPY26918.1 type VI secretion system baseplate subunit TssF [Shewanella sp. YLB-07]QDO83356.1 type VI secretion system baseplate subunit TssF [Shewanella psychropiezotolerans]
MSDDVLSYFEQELRFIREEAVQFSERYPGSARALGISKDGIDDVQIAHLVESVAFLNGRLQKRLDDTFPELAESLIRLLFPHYLRPTPSFSMLDFVITEDINAVHEIPIGTEFEITDDKVSAVFRTTEMVELLPLKIDQVSVSFAPFKGGKQSGVEHAKALIEISISTFDENMDLSSLSLERLKVQLKGDGSFLLRLYDLLFQGVLQISIEANGECIELGRDAMQPTGFKFAESVLPYQSNSFGGFKLLTEFFMFSERFYGFQLEFGSAFKQVVGNQFKVQIFVDDLGVDLARSLSEQHFSLFTVPIINLSQVVSEPIEVDFFKKQYPIVLDARGGDSLELFSVDQVLDVSGAEAIDIPHIYGEKFNDSQTGLRWQLQQSIHTRGVLDSYIRVADLSHNHIGSELLTWVVRATASNGIHAGSLGVTSTIECRESLTIPAEIRMLRRPTMPVRSKETNKSVWALLRHLHFNYHSVMGSDDPVSTLKTMFELYNFNQSSLNQLYIDALVGLKQEKVVAPIYVSGKACFAYGTKIIVTLDSASVSAGLCLFSHLLDHFFAFFAGFNSFTQVDIRLEGGEEVYRSFPRRSGCKSLL